MKKTLLLYALPFALYCLTALLIPGVQYGYFKGSVFNSGYLLGAVHLFSGLCFVIACMVPTIMYLFKSLLRWLRL